MVFVNRLRELQEIRALLGSDRFELLVLYGRRRIGKTELIKQALKGRQGLYFLCSESNNLAHFQADAGLAHLRPDWEVVLEALEGRTIVLDEFPYLVRDTPTILSTLSRLIDTRLARTGTKLVLLGSSIGMMEQYALAQSSPLFGRKTAHLKLGPLNFVDLKGFFPKAPFEELAEIYGFAGGVPQYLRLIDADFWTWLDRELRRRMSLLTDEVRFLLRTEFKEVRTYQAILEAVAAGRTAFKEIAERVPLTRSDISPYLASLETLELLERVRPVFGGPRQVRFRIKDPFVRFWHRFILPLRSSLELGTLTARPLRAKYPQYMGPVFEDAIKDVLVWLLRHNSRALPCAFTRVGSQWGTLPSARKGANTYEIDVCTVDDDAHEALFAECKWQHGVDPLPIIAALRQKTGHIPRPGGAWRDHFAVFAKSFSRKPRLPGVWCADLTDLSRMLWK